MNDKQSRVFFEIHSNMPRQGPGSYASTKRAFEKITLPDDGTILDIGCGPGQQTFDLARLTSSRITAVDYYTIFVDELAQRIKTKGLADQISVRQADMNQLPFPANSFDLIWSEGAIYIMGFENGLEKWRQLVKPHGYIAVSEITWLRDDPPQKLEDYWLAEYPVKSIAENLRIIKKCDYHLIDHFALPARDWWDNYYSHISARLPDFQQKYKNDPDALQVIEAEKIEMEMHKKYSDFYSYVFYVMQKTE